MNHSPYYRRSNLKIYHFIIELIRVSHQGSFLVMEIMTPIIGRVNFDIKGVKEQFVLDTKKLEIRESDFHEILRIFEIGLDFLYVKN